MDADHNPSDRSAWIERHADKLLLFARQQTRCEADAQDVVQESLWEVCQRCDEAELLPLGLVFATIRRRSVDLARRNDRRTRRELAALDCNSVEWFDSSVEQRDMIRLIQEALKQLPETQREVVTLHLWGGLTFVEVGSVLDISANTAASRYRYGVEALRKQMVEALV